MDNVYYKDCNCQGCYNWRIKFLKQPKKKIKLLEPIIVLVLFIILGIVYYDTRNTNESYSSDSFSSLYNLQTTTIIN